VGHKPIISKSQRNLESRTKDDQDGPSPETVDGLKQLADD
jgi:hypothetical protein